MSHDRINGLVRRVMRLLIDVTRPSVEVQVETLTDEIHSDVEVIETYGMTVYPPDDAPEGLAIFPNGESDNGIVIAWRDPFYRPTFLLEGEVAFYSKWEQLIHFTQAGEVKIIDKAGSEVLLDAGGNIVLTPAGGKVKVVGDLEVSGNTDFNGATVKHGGKDIGKTHKHSGVSTGVGNSGVPI